MNIEHDSRYQHLEQQVANQEQLLQKIHHSVEQTRKYFLWTLIGSVVMFILPLIGLLVIIPRVLDTLSFGLL